MTVPQFADCRVDFADRNIVSLNWPTRVEQLRRIPILEPDRPFSMTGQPRDQERYLGFYVLWTYDCAGKVPAEGILLTQGFHLVGERFTTQVVLLPIW